jgi:type IV secretory pathway VirD2 relaxase
VSSSKRASSAARAGDFRSAPLVTHVAYLRRDCVTDDEQKAQMFDARSDTADDAAFVERCKNDRHHFRFIVSPEDATEMEDLRAFTRDLLREAERDLGTKLDWAGVDHWNTDNPHIHILLRGKADDGADLVISRDYISNGMRARAERLVGLEFGPKPERRIHEDLAREVDADRWTRLDRTISVGADETGIVDLRPGRGQTDPNIERRKIVPRDNQDHAPRAERGAARAKHDRFRDSRREGSSAADREAHRAWPRRRTVRESFRDHRRRRRPRSPFALSEYEATSDAAPGAIVELRRFEDASGAERIALAVRSGLSLENQIKADGATWLDRRLVESSETPFDHVGFGQEVREALSARIEHLSATGAPACGSSDTGSSS